MTHSDDKRRGCKCVELDCWDDQNINQPVVYHGYTMTSKILFQSIISCIKNYIDVVNPDTLPIVLSLENHCSPNFQQMMATILISTLGDRIYIHDEGFTTWPSPLDLVGKVLLKGGQKVNDNHDSNSLERNKSQSPRSETFNCPSSGIGISRMTLMNTIEFRSFSSSFDLPSTAMHSVDETKFLKILNNDPSHVLQWKQFNTAHMTRIYPHGSRMDSSNYNPLVAWAMGIQLVALNFQTDDSAMTINDGRFRVCGGCGYVLKPPSVLLQMKSDDKMQLRIKILSASILPKAYGGAEGM
jgi:phosphatidylinositol phospholipase C delta